MRFPKPSPQPQRPPEKRVRIKNYAAQTGFVYQYYFDAEHDTGTVRRYTFQASASRGSYLPVVIELEGHVSRQWQQSRNRELSPTEFYAFAKMTLFAAFDDEGFALPQRQPLSITIEAMDNIAAVLNLI